MSIVKKNGQYYVKIGSKYYGPYSSAGEASAADKKFSSSSSSSSSKSKSSSSSSSSSSTTYKPTTAANPSSPIITSGYSGKTKEFNLHADGRWYTKNGYEVTRESVSSSVWERLQEDYEYAKQDYPGAFEVSQNYSGPTVGGDGGAVLPKTDISELANSIEFKSLPQDQQELVRQVFQTIAENDVDNAERLAVAFETAESVSDPFFKQQIRIARDAIERGFVSIDQEDQFREQQLRTNLADLKQDLETRREYLGLEEQAALRGIEREYTQNLKLTRQNLAARGFSSSSMREEAETLLDETTGDLRESTQRRFGAQISEVATQLNRGERDFQTELSRLQELSKEKRLELFRGAEETLGTAGLSGLQGAEGLGPLGDLVGDIPQKQAQDIISGATQLIF